MKREDDLRPTRTLTGSAAPRAHVRECQITVLDGALEGTVHRFAAGRMVIGGDPRADFVVTDPTISRFHCEVRVQDGAPFARDLGSRNGTYVDRVPIVEAPLRDAAILTLGRTSMRFGLGSRQIEIPLSPNEHFGRLRGGSVAMRAVYAELEAAASGDATVLLQGESGTGKDLAAESVHLESARRDGPFVVVDCGAISANLIDAELFGHEEGAFTGASTARVGAFESAQGGTLLLDEIGELPLELQPKLLRAIDRREIQRIGSSKRIAVDVRIIAATNRNLKQEVNARRFRSDLYFRLAVLVLTMPPLRERTADIPVLVDTILESLGDRDSAAAKSVVAGDMLAHLLRHSWPGNVRELRNHVEAYLVHGNPSFAATSNEPTIDVMQPLRAVRERWLLHVERRYLEQSLALHKNNVSAAARAAGIDRVHMHRLLSRAGLR